MPIDRAACVRKYIALQDKARKLLPTTHTPHITADMSDAEIVRLGRWLAELVKKLESK